MGFMNLTTSSVFDHLIILSVEYLFLKYSGTTSNIDMVILGKFCVTDVTI